MSEIVDDFKTLPNECREANSKIRVRTLMVTKGHNYPREVYIPLNQPTEAKMIRDNEFELDTCEYKGFPVAVYELDVFESIYRPFDFYIYKGDKLK
jgi:hypothetical protein